MTRTLAISDTGLRLIKAFEGFRPDDRTLVTGIRIVGYGHRLDAADAPVHMSRADAEQQLLTDLEPIETVVNDEVHTPLSQGQFDALCSLALNIGIETFRTSDIVRAMNNGRVLDAANGFDVWRKATVNGKTYVVDALMRRRTAEKSLFLRHEPAVPAPSAMLRPQADNTAPFGPTDDGLPRVTADDASGVVERANIINAERADAANVPAAILTVPGSGGQSDEQTHETDVGSDFIDADNGGASDIMDLDQIADGDDVVDGDEDDLDDLDDTDFEEDEDDLIDLDLEDNFEGDDFDDLDDEDYDDDFDDDETDDDKSDADDVSENDDSDADDFENDERDNVIALDDDSDDVDEADSLVEPIGSDKDDEESHDDRSAEEEDDLDLSALIAGASSPDEAAEDNPVEVDAYYGAESDDDDDDESSSVISSAATSLGDRLTALLDTEETDQDDKADPMNTLPTSLLQPVNTDETEAGLVVEDAADEAVRSTLVSFPKRELVMEEPVTVGEGKSDESDILDTSGLKVIDDLAADDVIRASRDPESSIFDPDGDPVENAMRYLERQASENEAKKSAGGMWIPIALGALLVGASAVLIGRGATQMLSTWGPTAVTAAAITGGLTVIFGIYAAARSRFA